MSRAIRIVVTVFLACICQTDLVKYIRIAGIAPDMLTVFLVLLTGYTGAYGGFCAGSLLAMLYDASVGYVLAINLVCYAFIGWAAPMLRSAMNKKLSKVKHKSYLELMLICFFLTLMREIVYIGYLFLIGCRTERCDDPARPALRGIQRGDDPSVLVDNGQSDEHTSV